MTSSCHYHMLPDCSTLVNNELLRNFFFPLRDSRENLFTSRKLSVKLPIVIVHHLCVGTCLRCIHSVTRTFALSWVSSMQTTVHSIKELSVSPGNSVTTDL